MSDEKKDHVIAVQIDPLSSPHAVRLPLGKEWKTIQGIVEGNVELLYVRELEDGWSLTAHVNEDGIGMGLLRNRNVAGTPLFGRIVIAIERVNKHGDTEYRDVELAHVEAICRAIGANVRALGREIQGGGAPLVKHA